MKIPNVCVVLIWSCCILKARSRRPTSPQLTHFTIFDPSNPHAQETYRICPECPPGFGLPVQCGSRVSIFTSTDCEQCMEGETYSEKKDISECKSCDDCTGRNVLQKCSKLNNGKCGTCLPEYYLDSELDDCKKCSFCCEDALEHEHLRQCKAGVSIKAGYRRSTAACKTSYRRLFSPLGERSLTAPLVVTAAY